MFKVEDVIVPKADVIFRRNGYIYYTDDEYEVVGVVTTVEYQVRRLDGRSPIVQFSEGEMKSIFKAKE